jgi:hypothetical protein
VEANGDFYQIINLIRQNWNYLVRISNITAFRTTVIKKLTFIIRRSFLRLPKMYLYLNVFSNRLVTFNTTDTKMCGIDHGLSEGRNLGSLRERIIFFHDLIGQRPSCLFMEVLCC